MMQLVVSMLGFEDHGQSCFVCAGYLSVREEMSESGKFKNVPLWLGETHDAGVGLTITKIDLSGSSLREHVKSTEVVQRSFDGRSGGKKDGWTPSFAGKILSYLLAPGASTIGIVKSIYLHFYSSSCNANHLMPSTEYL